MNFPISVVIFLFFPECGSKVENILYAFTGFFNGLRVVNFAPKPFNIEVVQIPKLGAGTGDSPHLGAMFDQLLRYNTTGKSGGTCY